MDMLGSFWYTEMVASHAVSWLRRRLAVLKETVMEMLVVLALVALMVAIAGFAAQERRVQVRVPVRVERQRHIRRR